MKNYSKSRAIEEVAILAEKALNKIEEIRYNLIYPSPETEKEDVSLKERDISLLNAISSLKKELIAIETILRED